MYVIRATVSDTTWLLQDGDFNTAVYGNKDDAQSDLMDYFFSSDLDFSDLKIEKQGKGE